MKLLVIDTAANLCAVSVFETDGAVERGRSVRDIGKGHAEQLMSVITEALAASGTVYAGLGGIAVVVGPGSFTGVRVGVSTARGLSLALGVPAIGVTTLDGLADEFRRDNPGIAVLVAIEAGRDGVYAAVYDEFANMRYGPVVITMLEAARLAQTYSPVAITGSAAIAVASASDSVDRRIGGTSATADLLTYARLAASRPMDAGKPKPLYLREPDAKPQAGFILPKQAG